MLGFAVAVLAALGVLFLHRDSTSPLGFSVSSPSFGPPRPDKVLSAQDLFEAYCETPGLADQLYKNKVLELSGTVVNVRRDQRGEYFIFAVYRPSRGVENVQDTWTRIAVASASGVQGVRCYLTAGQGAPPMRGTIKVRGRCVGMPLDVELHDCQMVK
jgi:hypothetical protein